MKKKVLSLFLSAAVIVTMLTGSMSAFADDDITVTLDGQAIEFDVQPQIIDGRTMVPLRRIFEEIGAVVKWNGETQTVSARKNSKTISMVINSSDMQIDKGDTDNEGNPVYETVTLDVPSQIIDGRTLVPARAISEAFGLNVDWDDTNKNVTITSDEDDDESWKENTGTINLDDLTYTGEGVEISDKEIKITAGGDFTLTGTLDNGNITVNTAEKVKLRLSGVSITSSTNPCIYIENADKAYITITDGTENNLTVKDNESDAIYAKDNLEIKGDGTLNITANGGHAIKASDNLTIENGILNLTSESDGIHVNDIFKMTGGTINASVVGDGVDSESIVIIEGGEFNIETNATPIETNTTDILDNSFPMRPEENNTDVEFEKSSKGINAGWMIEILGGTITVNSASHAIHCQDEIEITGGTFSLNSTYDKGISAHGNLTIGGEDTVINITKSTEGLESKNILTINNGIIDIVSLDDAINATGGKTGTMMGGRGQMMPSQNGVERPEFNGIDKVNKGEKSSNGDIVTPNTHRENRPVPDENEDMQPPEFTGGENRPQNGGMMGGNMKDCLVINGGTVKAVAGDDCLDSNGNIVLNGGTVQAVKENGTFTGSNSVIDPDGTLTVGENVTLVLAARGGTDRGGKNGNAGGLSLPNNAIYLYSETSHNANESITLKNSSGDILAEYLPQAVYSAVLITSPDIEPGADYVLSVGDESHDITISGQNTVIGTQPTAQGYGGRVQRMPDVN
ncbi:MAG: carbohydrate-binding domain-containing protein [Clostridiales bacterium]|nr:carbohydrate-binding domain-containing protein [Clostridiales bacterium]